MRWLIFIIFAFAALVLELGLRNLLKLELAGDASPGFVLILAVFIATWAPPRVALWSGLILGLLLDLTTPFMHADGAYMLMGPAALGYLLGSYAVVQLRGLMYRDSPFALAALVFLGGIFVHLMIVAVLTVRGLPFLAYPIPGWDAPSQLYHRFWELLYSAIVAVPIGFVLLRTLPLWAFEGVKASRRG